MAKRYSSRDGRSTFLLKSAMCIFIGIDICWVTSSSASDNGGSGFGGKSGWSGGISARGDVAGYKTGSLILPPSVSSSLSTIESLRSLFSTSGETGGDGRVLLVEAVGDRGLDIGGRRRLSRQRR